MTMQQIIGLLFISYGIIYAIWWTPKTIQLIKETYDNNLSTLDNANKYFDKYKKSKRTIENDTREIDIAKKSVEEIEHILSIFAYYSDSEIEELYKKYLPATFSKLKKKVYI